MKKIKALVVDDSALMRQVISDMLSSDPDIEVIGTAKNGLEALDKTVQLKPDVVTMDVEMPKMDGLTALCHLMNKNPLPVVMLTAMDKLEADLAIKSFEYGAVDFVSKPSKAISLDIDEVRGELLAKVKTASRANVKRMDFELAKKAFIKDMFVPPETEKKVLVIGASTGGPHALSEIIPKLHRNFPLAVLVVQHMPVGFIKPFAERLAWCGSVAVKEAADKDVMLGGQVFIAPDDRHMVLKKADGDMIRLNGGAKVNSARPSIDVTMKSAAKNYGDKAIGVLLSGMGSDGAEGMKAIKERGGSTIAQDEVTSVVFGMAKAAIELDAVDSIAPPSKIVDEILRML